MARGTASDTVGSGVATILFRVTEGLAVEASTRRRDIWANGMRGETKFHSQRRKGSVEG